MTLVSLRPEIDAGNPDQLLARFRANWPEIRRISATGAARFSVRTGRVRTPRLAIIEVKTSGYKLDADASPYMFLTMPRSAGVAIVSGRREWRAACGDVHYSDGRPFETDFADEFRGYHICVDKRAFREAAEIWCGEPLPTTIRDSEIFDVPQMNALAFEIAALEREAREGTLAEMTATRASEIETRFHAALIASPIGALARSLGATGQPGPAAIHRAAEYIRANFAEPLRAADLARAAGVNLRNLQAAFRRTYGASLWRHLTMCRLEAVRRRLLARDDPATVTQIALDAGFTHLGEFGRLYRARYGERPSETRRRPS